MLPWPSLRLDDVERARVVDLSRRLQPVSRRAIMLLIAAAAIAVPSFGWWPLVAMVPAAGVFWLMQSRLARLRRPEYGLAASWVLAQLTIVLVVAVADGPRESLLQLFTFPMMLASVVWPTRWVVAGCVFSVVALVSVALATEAELLLATPPLLTHALAFLASTVLVASIVRDTEAESRAAAVVDQLTGLLNRSALEARMAELEHLGSTEPVAVIVADVDHFKRINDEHGHATGDAVLRDVAYRLRRALPPFAGVYRYGGEEFVVLLTGAGAERAAGTAEHLRAAVAGTAAAGLPVTMSFGVASPPPGERAAFRRLFAAADAALYRAKADGRDAVQVAVPDERRAAGRPERRQATRPGAVPPAARPAAFAPDGDPADASEPIERQHLVDLTARLRHRNHVPYAIAFLALVVLGPWFGWWPILPVVLGSIVYRAVERRLERFKRPEPALWAAFAVAQLANASAYAVADVPPGTSIVCALPLLILMVVSHSAVFPARYAALGVAWTGLLIVAAALSMDAGAVLARPTDLAFTLAMLGAISLIGSAIGKSTLNHRGAALVDPLTGVLNRRALEARGVQVLHQARLTRAPVSVVLGDLDRFKRVNDVHGHAHGDLVLREVAGRLEDHLRATETVFRLGGEEFVVLLPGCPAADAAGVAERLRAAVAGEPLAALALTMSFGVATAEPGDTADLEALLARADAALYAAKDAGRDGVRAEEPRPGAAPDPDPAQGPAAAAAA